MFLETQDMKPDTRKSRNHRIPWPHPVFFAKAAHKLDCPIIAHLRIFLVVVIYSYCLVFIVNNFENVGSLKWPIFTFLIMNIERIEPFFFVIHNFFFQSHRTPPRKTTIIAMESNLNPGNSLDDISVANK